MVVKMEPVKEGHEVAGRLSETCVFNPDERGIKNQSNDLTAGRVSFFSAWVVSADASKFSSQLTKYDGRIVPSGLGAKNVGYQLSLQVQFLNETTTIEPFLNLLSFATAVHLWVAKMTVAEPSRRPLLFFVAVVTFAYFSRRMDKLRIKYLFVH